MISATYKYPDPRNKRLFVLAEIRQFTYVFKCGHVVSDSVFEDLICVNGQLKLEI